MDALLRPLGVFVKEAERCEAVGEKGASRRRVRSRVITRVCTFVPYTFSETKPQMVKVDLNTVLLSRVWL